jgi:hypothetical protein
MLAAFLTIWGMFSCYLLFHVMGLPPLLPRLAMTILMAEMLSLAAWSYYGIETARDLAVLDVPLSAGLFVAVTAIAGLLADRRARRQAV